MKYFCIVLLMFIGLSAAAEDYGKLMQKKIQDVLGKNALDGCKVASYPVDNFGIATAYEKKVSVFNEICATWSCLVGDQDPPTGTDALMKLKVGDKLYADPGKGSPIQFDADESRKLSFKALIPKLFQVLSLDLSFANDKNLKTELSLGEVTNRRLKKDNMISLLKGNAPQPSEKAAFQTGTLVLVYADFVVDKMQLTLTLDKDTNAALDAKLTDSLGGKVGKVFGGGKDSSLGFKVDSATKGKYVLSIAHPVVLATCTAKQPHAGTLGKKKDFSDWKKVDVPNEKITHEQVDLGE